MSISLLQSQESADDENKATGLLLLLFSILQRKYCLTCYKKTGSNDWIARGLNHNVHWDKEIPQQGIRLDINHSFSKTYAPDVHPVN